MVSRILAKCHSAKALLLVAAFLILVTPLIAVGCSPTSQGATLSSQPSTTSQPVTTVAATPAPSTPTATAAPSSNTAGAFADQGSKVYALACASCHGNNGQGGGAPALTGAKTNLASYKTANVLLDYIAKAMPPEAPGSLTPQQSQQLAAFILVQDNLVSGGAAWDPGQLSNIVIK